MRIWTGLLCWLCLAGPGPAQTVAEDDLAQARALGRAGRHAEAIGIYERLVGEIEAREGDASGSLVYLSHELAVQHHSLGQTAAAESLYRRSLALAEQTRGAQDGSLVPSLRGLAALAAMQGRLADAEAFYRRALAIEETDAEARTGLARTLAELGLLCQLQERSTDAEDLYRRALEIADTSDLSDNEVATTAANLAALYARQGRDDQAVTYYGRALEIRQGILGADHPDLVKLLGELASLQEGRHQWAEAASLYQRILRIRELADANDLALSGPMSRLGAAYRQLGRSREAEVHFRMAESILDAHCGGRDPARLCREATAVHQEAKTRPVVASGAPAAPDAAESQGVSEGIMEPETPASAGPAPAAPPPPRAAPARSSAGRRYRAQVAARQDRAEATELLERMQRSLQDVLEGLPARVVRADLGERGVWYRVQIGEYPRAAEAKALCAELTRRGHEGCWVIETTSE